MRIELGNIDQRKLFRGTHRSGATGGELRKKSFSFALLVVSLVAALLPQFSNPASAGHHGGGGGGGGGQAKQAARATRVQQRAAAPAFRQPKAARMPRVARQPNFARQAKPARQARRVAVVQRGADRRAAKNTRQVTRNQARQLKHQAVAQKHVNKKVQKQVIANANKNAKAIRKQNHAAQTATARANKFIANTQSRNNRLAKQQFKDNSKYQRAVIKAGRWDAKLDNKNRYRAYRNYRKNWSTQRAYLNSNLSRFNQLAAINQAQQAQLASQMQAAYLAYHNNNYNGAYNWNAYSNPQFLDYLQYKKPSLLQQILSALGMGSNDDYLYSPSWDFERSQLAQNLANIHQLVLAGRISPTQEQVLINQMQPQYMAYNNQFSGVPTWSQYSDPGFVDYLHNRQPGILTTVRDYLIR